MQKAMHVSLRFIDVERFDTRKLKYSYPIDDGHRSINMFFKDGHLGFQFDYSRSRKIRVLLQLSDLSVILWVRFYSFSLSCL